MMFTGEHLTHVLAKEIHKHTQDAHSTSDKKIKAILKATALIFKAVTP